jgi:hypothetical protein
MADRGQGRAGQAPGQQKVHTIKNEATGEEREITQQEWREQGRELRAQGFTRPEDEEQEEGEAGGGEEE